MCLGYTVFNVRYVILKLSRTLWDLPMDRTLDSPACLLFIENLLVLSQVPKNTFNQRSEKMQKQRKTVKQNKVLIIHKTKSQGNLVPPQVLSGEGNGTPLQYSCLENPMDGGAW